MASNSWSAMTSAVPMTPTEQYAAALSLVRLELIDGRHNGDRASRLHAALMAHRVTDDMRAQSVAREWAPKPMWEEPGTLLQVYETLSLQLLELRQGYPIRRPQLTAEPLLRLIDPDVLAVFHPELCLPEADGLSWSAVPRGEHPAVDALLSRSSADTHLHLGGALPPLFYWVGLMSGQTPLEQLHHFPSAARGHASTQEWQLRVSQALWLRYWLGAAVSVLLPEWRRLLTLPEPEHAVWQAFLGGGAEELSIWGATHSDHTCPPGWPIGGNGMPEPLRTLQGARRATLELLGTQRREVDEFFRDPLVNPPPRLGEDGRWIWQPPHHYALGERRLLLGISQVLRRAKEHSQSLRATTVEAQRLEGERGARGHASACQLCGCYRAVTRATYAYLSIRHAFHQLGIHDRGIEGLLRFQEAFHRRSHLSAGRKQRGRRMVLERYRAERHRTREALRDQLERAFKDDGLMGPDAPRRRVELRVSLPSHPDMSWFLKGTLNGMADYLGAKQGGADVPELLTSSLAEQWVRMGPKAHHQLGLVIHLLKRGEGSNVHLHNLRLTEQLGHLLRARPLLRPFVVGLDAAGHERRSSPRHFISAYARVHELRRSFRHGPGEPPLNLGLTYHAGEDCYDLLTGLRHIDEASTLLVLPGGRIGHALVLGMSPRHYYERRAPGVELPLRVHVLDLIWAWGRCVERDWQTEASHFEQCLRRLLPELRELSGQRVQAVWESMGLSVSGGGLRQGSVPVGPELSEQELLLPLGLSEERLKSFVTLRLDDFWFSYAERLQTALRARLVMLRVTLEVNPTSNLIVGGFESYAALPYHRLTQEGLPLSINTDDPGLFMSSLPLEFAQLYLAYSSVLPGSPRWSSSQALDWLEQRGRDADRSTFLQASTPAGYLALVMLRRV